MKGSALILLIDNDPGIREFMTMALNDAGYSVALAADADEGLDIARNQLPALILLELRLPGMSGLDFLKTYSRLHVPHAPIIALSTSSREEGEAIKLGAFS